MTDAEVDAAYAALSVGERPPRDDDPFDSSQVPGVDSGDYAWWPARETLLWVPADTQRRFGTVEGTMLDGDFLALDVRRERALVRAFERGGWRCVRDDLRVRRASGYRE